ncbi:hypothetical protein NDU88_000566 [Pleurodeles waltl]|uniref:Uncharacterized protein n=1 Tax=Pleurodeles waltl TaxID=8319 RepID=A0AAV7TFC6_PLEWA|nr:hypothetical protein NDU88_000566 [Pleurodeles waltl]
MVVTSGGGAAERQRREQSAVLRPAGSSWALFLVARIKDINMKSGPLASFILATTNGDEGHSFYQGPRV